MIVNVDVNKILVFKKEPCSSKNAFIGYNGSDVIRPLFEEDFFKLMNSSFFGRAMENVRNHRDVKIAHEFI